MRMRARTVHPEFFKSVELYEAEIAYRMPLRLAFEGLWGMADREGRFEWKPKVLKLDILPYDTVDFEEVLEALCCAGFIRRYEVDGKMYGLVPTLLTWQHIHKDEAQSKLPVPPEKPPETPKATAKVKKERRVTPRRPRKSERIPANPSGSIEIPRNPDESSPTSTSTSTSTLAPNGASNGNGHTPHVSRAPPQGHWVHEAVEIHGEHMGLISHGKLGGILKPLVDKQGWTVVKPVWEFFCEYSPVQDYLARAEANQLREGEVPVKKFGYNTSAKYFVEHFTVLARQVAA